MQTPCIAMREKEKFDISLTSFDAKQKRLSALCALAKLDKLTIISTNTLETPLGTSEFMSELNR